LSVSRRSLAAIMFTDMVDYTKLTEKNDALALSLLEEQRQLLRPIFSKHQGREIKTVGDGFLVEFNSALEAVRCAVAVQLLMDGRNKSVSPERRIMLRVAVHLGDVEHLDGDVYGDAVNVASRIHSLVEPGGICITRQVFDHVRNSDEFLAEELGETRLKNVRTPFEIYRVLPPETRPTSTGNRSMEALRIAALPLAIISSEAQDEYFANGLTEEIINTLSSIPTLRVIARTSVMRYRDTKKTASEIGRELNVGTILEGSVRKAGDRVRIAVQLIDVNNEEPVWAEKYDRELKDVFKIQADIAERVAGALKVRLLKENRSLIEQKAPLNISAYVLYLRGRYHWSKRNKEDLEKAISYFREAIEKEPNYALAYAGIADCYTLMGRHLYLSADDAFAKAREYANRALELNENLAEAHTSLAAVLINYDWDWKKAQSEFERAIELNPNYATAHYWFSVLLETLGRVSDAVLEAEKAQQLDPLSPVIGMGVVQAYLFDGHYDKAIDECHRYLDMDPNFVVAHDFLVHLYVQKKMFKEAAEEAKRLVFSSERQAEALAHVAFVKAASGDFDEARRTLRESVTNTEKGYSNPSIFITAYSTLGELDSAFDWTEKAFESGRVAFPTLMLSPDLKKLRADPRFGILLRRAGLKVPPSDPMKSSSN